MENTGRYIIIAQIGDSAREHAFFNTLREIDPEPLTVVNSTVFAINCRLKSSEICNLLGNAINDKDTLLVIMIGKQHAEQSPEFKYWWLARD